MSQQLLPPDIRRLIASLEQRVSALERRLQFNVTSADPDEIIFTLPGTLSASESPPVRIRNGAQLTSVVVNLGTAGTSTTTVQLRRSGVSVVSVSLTSGSTLMKVPASVRFGADQELMTAAITAVGAGARNLTLQARLG